MSFFTEKRKLADAASSKEEVLAILYGTLDEVEELNETMGFRYERDTQKSESDNSSNSPKYRVICTDDCI